MPTLDPEWQHLGGLLAALRSHPVLEGGGGPASERAAVTPLPTALAQPGTPVCPTLPLALRRVPSPDCHRGDRHLFRTSQQSHAMRGAVQENGTPAPSSRIPVPPFCPTPAGPSRCLCSPSRRPFLTVPPLPPTASVTPDFTVSLPAVSVTGAQRQPEHIPWKIPEINNACVFPLCAFLGRLMRSRTLPSVPPTT